MKGGRQSPESVPMDVYRTLGGRGWGREDNSFLAKRLLRAVPGKYFSFGSTIIRQFPG